jgi:hypothetical protein
MSFWTGVAVVGSVIQSYGDIYQGHATKAYYDAQAMMKEFEGKVEATKAKEQGNVALANLNATLATAIARAGSGGAGFEGYLTTLTTSMRRGGVEELKLTQLNEKFIKSISIFESSQLRQAGKVAKKSGYVNAFARLAIQGANMENQGLFNDWKEKWKNRKTTT